MTDPTLRLPAYFASSGWLMGIGGGSLIVLWTAHAREPLPADWHHAGNVAAAATFFAGVALRVVADMTIYIVNAIHEALDAPLSGMAAQMQMINADVATLLAARTVDLAEMREEIHGVADGAARAANMVARVTESLDVRFGQMDVRFNQTDARLVRLQRLLDAALRGPTEQRRAAARAYVDYLSAGVNVLPLRKRD